MSDVVSRSRMPSVARRGCAAPGEVLFKRGVGPAGVAATGCKTVSSIGPSQPNARASVCERIPVRCVLGVLRRERSRVGIVASEFCVEPPLSAPVASQSACFAYPTVRIGSPASTFPHVLLSLRRRAAAAKVSRRLRRLGEASGSGQRKINGECGPVWRDAGRELSVRGVVLRQSRVVASREGRLRSVASVSVSEFQLPASCGSPVLQ